MAFLKAPVAGQAEVSMALGERELFPKVRKAAAEGKVVIADGFSCRTQIEQVRRKRATF